MVNLLSNAQLKFILNSKGRWNLAHGAVSSGKTVATIFRFMQAVEKCPDSQIWIIGHTSSTVYDNIIRLLIESTGDPNTDPLSIFRPFCHWMRGERELIFRDKRISTVGAKDSGAIGAIQGKTMSIAYCDEMTLYPDSIIDMIDTRLRNPHSIGIATMNPSYPTHKIKGWIDKSRNGDENYFEQQFTLDDNPYLLKSYKERIKNSLSGIFFKRNYLGEWCLAEGAIFDFFDRNVNVLSKPPRSADYWVVGVDFGTSNAFAAVLVGINTGKYEQREKPIWWVEDEFYWDSKVRDRQKTSAEFAREMKTWLEPYSVKSVYIDPSAANFRLDLQKLRIHPVNANNEVLDGITKLTSMVKDGEMFILDRCRNLIREIEGYVWHPKCSETGEDKPLKMNDHAIDALRYVALSHKPAVFSQEDYWDRQRKQLEQRNQGWRHPNDFGFRS